MKRSRLLSTEFSMNDVIYNSRSGPNRDNRKMGQKKAQNLSQSVTTETDLFKGISFKRLASLDTVDAD